MEIQSVISYKAPAYPDKEKVMQNPNLLKKLPERWKNNALVCTALSGLLLMTFTACTKNCKPVLSDTAKAQLDVPFFEHGSGRGSFGCVSVSPPAFLSEEEAFSVINETAKKEGINFINNGISVDTYIPYTYAENAVADYKQGSLTLDGYCKDKKIAFEFVSTSDVESWCNNGDGLRSSVTNYYMDITAKALLEKLNQRDDNVKVAVFYDPMYKAGKNTPRDGSVYDIDKIKEYVKQDLRKQVQDFISWLKAENII